MLETFLCDHTDGHMRLKSVLSDDLSPSPYESLRFLTWVRIWREAAKYQAKHRASEDETYFFGWQNCEFFRNPRVEHDKLYANLPS